MFKKILLFSILLLSSSILQAQDNILVYNAYGNAHHIFIQGRMEEKKNFSEAQEDDNWFQNLWRTLRQVKGKEIKNRTIFALINGEKFQTQGDDEGYFEFDIITQHALQTGYKKIALNIEGNSDASETEVTIIGSEPLVGIISDFDDTIIVSNVTNKIELGYNTVFKNYKQRTVVPTMLERFEKILEQNPKDAPSTLFILSGSPQQLFFAVEDFLTFHHFPKHILILKKAHGDNKDPLTDQFAYKTQKIERLINLYPTMQWVMFGDSGERDVEVYQFIKKKYPSKVSAYYIRDVKSGVIRAYR
jgi:phosphatidate phosphatase APP1